MNEDQPIIKDESSDAGIRLVCYVDNKPWASASASADVISEMHAVLKLSRDQILNKLKAALDSLWRDELEKVIIDPASLHNDPPSTPRFVAPYIYRDYRDVVEGLVWYDVGKGETGPSSVPALVRNKMRFVVHERLVAGNEAAEKLLEIFKS
jgi:hypothetical protein